MSKIVIVVKFAFPIKKTGLDHMFILHTLFSTYCNNSEVILLDDLCISKQTISTVDFLITLYVKQDNDFNINLFKLLVDDLHETV